MILEIDDLTVLVALGTMRDKGARTAEWLHGQLKWLDGNRREYLAPPELQEKVIELVTTISMHVILHLHTMQLYACPGYWHSHENTVCWLGQVVGSPPSVRRRW